VNEPTAGAIAYGFESQIEEQKTVLVFDFGGGTLDVSLLAMEGTSYTVRAVSGDTHLGGRDIDELVVRFCLTRFDPSGEMTIESLSPRKRHCLRAACEEAKCDLSGSTRANVFLENFHADGDLDVTITRDELEEMCSQLFDRILQPVEEVLERGETTKTEIDEVIMIGGSSMIPAVRGLIERFFDKSLFQRVSPLEAVTKGATIMASKIKGSDEIPEIAQLDVCEICPVSLGVEDTAHRMWVVIPAGSRLPAMASTTLVPSVHNQTSLRLSLYEGPWHMSKRNQALGSFEASGIPPAEAQEEVMKVTFALDLDGILTATAVVVSNGATTSLTVMKTGRLKETGKVKRTAEERESEKAIDQQEYGEAWRQVCLENLAKNLGTFFNEEPSKNPEFDQLVSHEMQTELLELVRGAMSAGTGQIPSAEMVTKVFDQVQETLRTYMTDHRKGIPAWLTWYC
jgi:L1 cell adhesion molecule like protein